VVEGLAQQCAAVGPSGHRRLICVVVLRGERRQDSRNGCDFLRCGLASHDAQLGVLAHSGMFPCFLGGSEARFLRSARSARTTCTRVSLGRMTRST
jgi:hypothetical protein